jgi:glutamyl-tRNA synthetase
MEIQTTRLAPSPTGALHLGNALMFVVNWAMARQSGWRVVLRIEDLDTPRIKPGVIERTIATLEWLGLDWDEIAPLQSVNTEPYIEAMCLLASKGLVYPCPLSRKEIALSAGAPHDDTGELRFDESLRPTNRPTDFHDTGTNWRLVVPNRVVNFNEHFAAEQSANPSQTVGDFVVWTQRGQPSYQLAVTVDDDRQGITQIVRGNDLLDSAARQTLVRDALGIRTRPHHYHLPLVRGPDGRRLAKRHGDTRVDHYRDKGVSAERVLALLARWGGIEGDHEAIGIQEFAKRLKLDTMPPEDVTFTPEDDQWLLLAAAR